MNSILAHESSRPETARDRLLRWLPLLLIVLAALIYYGSYWRYWFNPHDEGGTACLIAQRLMDGERPWVDVEPGYNIGWFYPLIALFKITGVNYLAARAWFFVLSTITALLGFSIVQRITGSRWIGLGAGLVLVALPGSQFKNYIQLAQAANAACLIGLVFTDPAAGRKWLGAIALGGAVLGLTYLVRVELGFFFTAIWVLLLLLFLLDRRLPGLRRWGATMAGLAALAGGAALAQTPAYLDLRGRGLTEQYWVEYSSWFSFLRASLKEQVQSPPPTTRAPGLPSPAPEIAPERVPAIAPASTLRDAVNAERSILPRKRPADLWRGEAKDRMLAFLTYAPLAGFAVFFVAGLLGFLRGLARGAFTVAIRPMLWLLLVGASLTTFPQFFFFRPDRPHLSEFMTGHIIAMSACLWLLWPRRAAPPLFARLAAWSVALFLAGHLAVFTTFAMQHPSAGTISARTGRKTWFHGENGVHVREFKRQAASLQGIHDVVMKAAGPEDYVICFPYMPGYNVMTNRRTYLRNVYVDNATRSANWCAETIRDLEAKRPAVVIIDDRAINGTEVSRFSRWAPEVQGYLKTHYARAAKFEDVEVFTRPAAAVPAP